jgi:N-acetylglucosamine-6-sulfatase
MFRAICIGAITVALTMGLVGTAAAGERGDARPNVVVVMTDDQDFRSLQAIGKTVRHFKRNGTTFDQNIVNFPLCCPSRATYLTGQYAHNHGVKWNNWPEGGFYRLRQKETLPVWLRRAGYRTIHIGKYLNETGERAPHNVVPTGWDDWHGGVDPSTYAYYGYTLNHNGRLQRYGSKPSDYSTDVLAGIAERSIRRAKRTGKPFFMNVAPIAPHTVANEASARIEGTPALPPPRYAKRYANASLPDWPNLNEEDISDKPSSVQQFFPQQLNQEELDALTRHYRGRMGALLAVDDMVMRIIRQLKRAGVYDNTVIVFTSDNGWILGEHRMRDPVTMDGQAAGVKYVPYEGSSRVPLMISGPGFPKRRTVKGVTSNVDLAPTILDIANARATLPADGLSLLPVSRKPSMLNGRAVLLQTFTNPRNVPPYRSVRTQRYRYDTDDSGEESLWDLKRDPWELQNVAGDPRYARVKAILARQVEKLRNCKGATCRNSTVRLPEPGS